jgi:UDPglucose--hexose-1-phosphate uridylyltransferase
MPELRVDPLSGDKVLIAPERADRPGDIFQIAGAAPLDHVLDPFLPGNEDETPPEILAVPASDGQGWSVRVVPNRYPALEPDAPEPPRSHDPDLYTSRAANGHHEVVVNAPEAVQSLADLSSKQVRAAMEVWRERMRAHADAPYVHVIVNERNEAGASQPHTHAQVFALPFVPAVVARERERFGAYAARTMGGNLLADYLQEEVRQRERVVASDDEAVLLTPFAAKAPFQMMIVPRTPRGRFDDDGPLGGGLLHDALLRLRRRLGASPPLNVWVRTAPRGAEHFCWHIDIWPRLTHPAGLELGAGVHINIVTPEQAAAELRAS